MSRNLKSLVPSMYYLANVTHYWLEKHKILMYNAASLKGSQFSTYRNPKHCFSEWKESDNIPFETI